MEVEFKDIQDAAVRIANGVMRTPCNESLSLSGLLGCRCFTKLEYMHRTGSFKERGARNALELLDAKSRARGVVAASAGNHALALAYHARELGIPVTVVMPRFAPLIKQARCRSLGARVIMSGENIAEAKLAGDALVESEGLTYVHGFDGHAVIAGQGTIGLELVEQVPGLDAVVVPIGGGGLIAGVGLAIKTLLPRVEVIGVEPKSAASFAAARAAGSPVTVKMGPTLADGLAVPRVGDRAFALASRVVDREVLVGEEELSLAVLRLAEMEKGVVEGAGAAPLAAMLSGKLAHLAGKRVALLLCGGNIDPAVLGRVIDYGLVADGRVTQFSAMISDRPGGLAELTAAIASAGASVKQINHDRAFGGADISTVTVVCTVETRDAEHIGELHDMLSKRGIRVISQTSPWSCEVE